MPTPFNPPRAASRPHAAPGPRSAPAHATRLHLPLRPLAVAAALAAGAPLAWSLPEGAQLRFGQAQVQATSPQQLDIRQTSQRAGLDWTSFSIGAGELVRISQPGRDAVLLNRVTGSDPSRIFGSLQSNGTVWLVNPRGIVFGRDSQVDVGGLLASTLGIRSDDMAAGRLLLSRGTAEAGSLQADGRISAPDGSVVLVAPSLVQGGLINARRIGLAAATEVQVDVDGDGLIFFNARNDGSLPARLQQLGTLRADGGTAELRAAGRAGFADTVLNLDGVVQARSIGLRGGHIVIAADDATARVTGTLDASGTATGEQGGQVDITGQRVGLFGQALVDVRGSAGGGQVRIGGDYLGGGTLARSEATVLGTGAEVRADALDSGQGGRVIVWSDGNTLFNGRISAAGGVQGGAGGFVETSGKLGLGIQRGRVSFGPRGGGTWLLDPQELNIATNGADPYDADVSADGFNDPPTSLTVDPAALNQANADILLRATQRVNVNNDVNLSKLGATLTIETNGAGAVINVDASLTTNNGAITLNNSNAGASAITLGSGKTINAGTADITLKQAGGSATLSGSLSTAGALVIDGGAGTRVTLAAANTLGLTTVSGSTLVISGAAASAGAGDIDLGGNRLEIGNGSTVANAVTVADGSIANIAGGTGEARLTGNISLSGSLGLSAGGAGLRVSGSITQVGNTARAVSIDGGTVTLAGANSYTGNTTINAGTLVIDGSGGVAASAGTAAGTIGVGNNRLEITNGSTVANAVTVAAGTIANSAGAGGSSAAGQLTGSLTLGGNASLLATGAGLTVVGPIGQSLPAQALAITGGTVTLANTVADGNTYSGGTSVSPGATLALSGTQANAGPSTSTISLGDNSTLDIRGGASVANPVAVGAGARIASSSGGGTLALGDGAGLDLAAGASTLFLSGGATQALVVARPLNGTTASQQGLTVDAGRVQLSAASTHDGSTTVRGGARLQIDSAAALGASGSTLTLGGSNASADSGTLALPAGLVLTRDIRLGAGGGAVDTTAGNATVSGLVSGLVAGSAFTKTGSNDLALTNTGNSFSGGTTVAAGRLVLANPAVLGSGGLTLDGGTLARSGGVAITIASTVTLGPAGGNGTGSGSIDTSGGDLTLTGTVQGGALVKAGSGTLSLANASPNTSPNTYAGSTTVTDGTLRIDSAAALGGGSSLVLNGGTLARSAGATAITLGQTVTLGPGGGNNTGSGSIDTSGGDLVLAGSVQGGALVKLGANALALTAANTYAGGTTVDQGRLVLRNASANVAASAGSGSIGLAAGTRLDIDGGASVANLVTLAGNATIGNTSGAGSLGSLPNNAALTVPAGATLTLASSGDGLALQRPLAGGNNASGLVVTGSGPVALNAANGLAGGTVVSAGTLVVGSAAALGTAGSFQLDGGTLQVGTGFGTSRPVDLGAGGGTISVAGGEVLTLNGVVAGVGAALAKAGAGTLVLGAANSYSGGTSVNAGTLAIDAVQAALASAGSGTIQLNGNRLDLRNGASVANDLTVGNGATLGNSAGSGTLAAGTGTLNLPGGATLTLSSGGTGLTVARQLTDTGDTGRVTVSGSGTAGASGPVALTAASANTHGGGTTVSGRGVLVLAGAGALGDGGLTLDNGSLRVTANVDTARPVALAAGGGTIDVDNGVQLGLTGGLTGASGTLTKTGAGSLRLAPAGPGSNSQGSTVVNSGRLVLATAAALGSGSLVLDGGTLAPTADLSLANAVTLGAVNGTGSGTVDTAGVDLTLTGPVGGAALAKSGSGMLVLMAANSYTGGTTVSGGTLRLGHGSAAGTQAIALAGHALDIVGGAVVGNALTVADGARIGSSSGGGTLGAGNGATLALAAGNSNLQLSSGPAQALVLARPLLKDAAGQQRVTVAGGVVELAGASTYTGGTTVQSGTLRLSADTAAGDAAGTITLGANRLDINNGASVANPVAVLGGAVVGNTTGAGTLAAGTALSLGAGAGITFSSTSSGNGSGLTVARQVVDTTNTGSVVVTGSNRVLLTGANSHDGGTTVSGGGTLVLASAAALGNGRLTLNGGTLLAAADLAISQPLTLGVGGSGSGTVDTAGQRVTLSGPVDGGALAKAGSGSLTLTAANSYTGGTSVAGGTLVVDGSSVAAASAGTGAIALGGNRLDINGGASVANTLTVADGATIGNTAGAGTLAAGADLALVGGVGVTLTSSSSGANSGLTMTRTVSDTANDGRLTVTGGQRVLLTGANSHGGGTTVTAGTTLLLASAAALGQGGLVLDGGTLAAAADLLIGRPVTLGGNGSGSGTVDTAGFNVTLAGVVGGGALAKNGGGSLTLNANNTYAGGTTVSAGTLAIDAGGSGSGADAGSGPIALGASTLDLRNGAAPANAVAVVGGLLANTAGAATLAGTLTLGAGGVAVSSTGSGAGLRLGQVVGESVAGQGVTVTGGTVTLAQANSYSGATRILAGTLVIDAGGTPTARAGTAGSTIEVGAAGRLDLVNGASVANPVTVASGAHISSSAGGGTLAGGAGQSLALAAGDSTLRLSGSGSGALVVARPLLNHASGLQALVLQSGVVALAVPGTFDGGTTVQAGTLRLAGSGTAGSAAITLGSNALDITDGASVGNALAVASGARITNSSGTGTLAFNASAVDLGASANITLASTAGGLLVDRAFSGAPGNTATVAVTGAGGVTLARASSHGGGTSVSGGGRLVIGAQDRLGTGRLTLDGGTLAPSAGPADSLVISRDVDLGTGGGTVDTAARSVTLAGTVAGAAGALAKTGGQALVLSAANSYGGGTTVQAGTLVVSGNGASAGSGAIALGGNRLDINDGASVANPLTLAGGATLGNTSGSGTLAAGASAAAGLALANGAVLNLASSGSGNSLAVLRAVTDGAGPASLAVSGSGRVLLGGANSHDGGTTVAGGGTLVLASAAPLGNGGLVLDGGTLQASASFDTSRTLALGAGGGTVSVDAGRVLGLQGVVSGAAGALAKAGAGTLLLQQANTYGGGTTVQAGTLAVDAANAAASLGSGSASVLANATLDLRNGAVLAPALSVDGGTIANSAGSGRVVGAVTLAGDAMFNATGAGLTLAGAVGSSNTNRAVHTAGTVVLAAANSYRGTTTVDSGTLAISGAGADAGSSTIVLGSATLDIRNGATPANAATVAGGRITNTAGAGQLGGPLQLLGPATLSSGGSGLVLGNQVSEAGGAQALVIGGGTVALGSASTTNSHSGGTTVQGGATLVIASEAALGSGSLGLGGATAGLGSGTLAPSQALTLQRGLVLGAGGATLDTSGGTLTLAGTVSGAALTKAGANALVLSADNSFTGPTTVLAGSLRIDAQAVPGADAGSGSILVGGGVLDLVHGAAIGNAVTLGAGGTLGNSAGAGTLTAAGSLRLEGDAQLAVSGSGTGLVVAAAISQDGTPRALTTHATAGGAVTLAGRSSHGGGTTVASGTLRIDALADAQAHAGTGPIAVGGQVLDIRNGAVVANAVTLAGGTVANSSGSGTLAGTLALSGGGGGGGGGGTGGQLASTGSGLLVAGAISGSGGLQVQGGSVALSHPGNGFGGGTTVNAGSLQLLGGDALPDTGLLTLAGSGRLLLAASETIGALQGSAGSAVDLGSFTLTTGASGASSSFAGVAGGSGQLVKTGGGSFTLLGANTYTGSTTVADGVLALGGSAAAGRLPTGSTLQVSGGTLDLGGRSEVVAGVLLDGGSIVNGTLASARSIDLRAGSASAVLAGTSDSVGLDKTGAGTVVLSGANRSRGPTTVAAGTLQLAGGDNRLDPFSPLVVDGGTLDLGGGSHQVAAVQQNGGLVRNGGLVSASSYAMRAGSVSANLGGAGAGVGLDKTGPGTLALTGTNTYGSTTSVQGGTLVLAGAASTLPDGATLLVQGGTVDIGSHSETVGALDLRSGSVLGSSGVLTSTNAIGLHSGTVTAILAGAQGATKQGSGTVTLAGASQVTGTTVVSQGTLLLDGAQRLAAGTALVVAPAGSVTLGGDQLLQSLNLQGRMSGSGALTTGRADLDGGSLAVPLTAAQLVSNGNSSADAALRVGALSVAGGTLVLGAAHLVSDTAQVDVNAGATLQLGGADTVGSLLLRGTLAGTGTLTAGQYLLDGGTVQVPLGSGTLTSDGSSRLDASAAVSSVDVRSGTFTTGAAGSLDALPVVNVRDPGRWLLAGPQRIGRLTGNGSVDLQTHTLQTGAGGDSRFDGSIAGSLGSGGSLVKQGASTFALRGASSYGGDTVVEAGTLALAGADRLSASTAVRVAAGATLALDSANTVRLLHLAGTLAGTLAGSAGGTGTLTAAEVQLQGGRVDAALGAGALVSDGASTLTGPAAVSSLAVRSGSLTLAGGQLLTAAPATQVAAGSSLVLGGDTALGSLSGAGSVQLGNATLRTGVGGSSRFDGVISGSGGLVKQGSGSFTLGGAQAYQGPTTVQAGTLVLDGADRLADRTAVAVDSGATLRLAGSDTVASLQLAGTLAGSGVLSAASVALDGGTVLADLGGGSLASRGSSRLAGSAAAATVQVQDGRLTLDGVDRLAASAVVTVDPGARLSLTGDTRVASLQLAGTLDGSGRLSAASTVLQGATVEADLGGGSLASSGSSRLNGQAAVDSLRVDGGSLVLGSAGRLQGLPAVTLAGGARLVLGGDDTVGSLAGSGTLDLGGFTLATGAGASSSFAGVLAGSGGLVKRGADTSFSLSGTSSYTGPTWVAEGTLTVGDGGTAGALAGTSAFRVDGTLAFNRADAVLLAQPVAGSGGLTQAGSGTLTLAGSNKTHAGPTRVTRGTLATSGDEALSDTSTVVVGADAALLLGGAETIGALQAAGRVGLGSRLTAAGSLVFDNAATATGGGPLLLQAAGITATQPGNAWGRRLSLRSSGAVALSAGTVDGQAGSPLQPLTLGEVELGGGGRIRAASVLLDGAATLAAGTLVLDLTRGEVLVEPGGDLLGRLTPANRQLAFSDDLLRQSAASATNPVALVVAAGAQLDVQAGQGGSVALLNPGNRIDGGLSVVLGPAGQAWKPNLSPPAANAGGVQYSLQNRVRLAGSQLNIAGAGLQADVVAIEADGLATLGQAAIVAKLPFDNQAGTTTSLPALSLVLRDPGAFADSGAGATSTSFGSGSAPLRIDLGSASFGNRSDPLTSGGYISVLPLVRLAGVGRTAVFLQGPVAAAGYSFFYDGARRTGAVPVFYNGESATPPQVSGSISSTLSVSEGARKERFDEAVRTENVALRLRAGVIAEVGPGTPATVNTVPADRMRPPACTPEPGTLACP